MLNGHFYIGSAASLYNRKGEHFKGLRNSNHKNAHLQNAYNLYGADAFRFAIVEHVGLPRFLLSVSSIILILSP